MKSPRIDLAQDFIWKNARLLDRRLFAAMFLGASPRPVITALKAYQNQDGGFGNALEPDKRCPVSLPIDVEHGLRYLDLAGLLSDPQAHAELLLPACDFLETITTPEGGVPFTLPVASRYPHAPWWGTESDLPASLNPTAGIAGLLLKGGVRHRWLDKASEFCWRAIEASDTEQYHDLNPVVLFLENTPDRQRAQRELERIAGRVKKPGVVEMDPQAGGYVKLPLDWAPTPASPLRPLFDDAAIAMHLAALAGRQQPDGGWPINWDPLSPAVELEWRGWMTINALHTLNAYQYPD